MADKDDAARGGDGRLDDTDDVGDRETAEERPHGKVLEAGGRRRELVAERIVLHVDADQVVQARGREAQDAGHLLGVEQVSSLVPMDPHATEVVAQQVVERVAGQEREAVGDPVLLIRVVVEVRLGPLPQLPDGLGSLLVGARPHAQADTVERVRRVLLKDEGVVDAVWLAPSGADLDIVRETSLPRVSLGPNWTQNDSNQPS